MHHSIKFSYECFIDDKMRKGKVPIEGTKVTNDGDSSIITDFGDGACDSLVEVTKDGEVETVDLKDLKRGDRFKNILKSKRKEIIFLKLPINFTYNSYDNFILGIVLINKLTAEDFKMIYNTHFDNLRRYLYYRSGDQIYLKILLRMFS